MSIAIALRTLGLTEAGANALMRARITGRLQGGIAADKLVKDGFAARLAGVSAQFGRPVVVSDKGREAQRVLLAAGWRLQHRRQ